MLEQNQVCNHMYMSLEYFGSSSLLDILGHEHIHRYLDWIMLIRFMWIILKWDLFDQTFANVSCDVQSVSRWAVAFETSDCVFASGHRWTSVTSNCTFINVFNQIHFSIYKKQIYLFILKQFSPTHSVFSIFNS